MQAEWHAMLKKQIGQHAIVSPTPLTVIKPGKSHLRLQNLDHLAFCKVMMEIVILSADYADTPRL
jgi:hypothetical protein